MPATSGSGGLLGDIESAGGLGLAIVAVDEENPPWNPPREPGVVRLATHRLGAAPTRGLEDFDILLSADPCAPAPWVGLSSDGLDDAIAQIRSVVDRQPVAAAVAAQVHRMTLKLTFEEAISLESLSYSMLLRSEGFRAWRGANPARRRADEDQPRVRLTREAGALLIGLTRPGARNAFDARMRDELVEALGFALVDPDAVPVILSGDGPNFSAGGDLGEFGQAADPGQAHAIRVLRSAARLVNHLGPRITARLHGACVGAGVEVPAAAGRVIARAGTTFRLPELSMGLIPGAGGTATIPRRIGRQRACYLAISGAELDLPTALAWGLIDGPDEGP